LAQVGDVEAREHSVVAARVGLYQDCGPQPQLDEVAIPQANPAAHVFVLELTEGLWTDYSSLLSLQAEQLLLKPRGGRGGGGKTSQSLILDLRVGRHWGWWGMLGKGWGPAH